METRYPIRKADGRDYQNYEELITATGKVAHGWWLVGVNRYWHGGIHVDDASSPASVLSQNAPETSVPLQCMADGEIVAWRVCRDYRQALLYENKVEKVELRLSPQFLLVHSIYKPDEHDEATWLTLHHIYMHMAPLSEYPKRKMLRVTVQGNGVRMRRYRPGDECQERIPDVIKDRYGVPQVLKQGDMLAVLREAIFRLDNKAEPFGLMQKMTNGRPEGEMFWASLRAEFMEPDGECYLCLPVWMHHALNHGVFNEVVIPPIPLRVRIKAGDPVGFLGAQDISEKSYSSELRTEYMTHIELLSTDEHVPELLANVKGIKSGRQYVKLKLKKPFYLRNSDGDDATFSQMSAITRKESGRILPREATHPFTDKDGITWFQIRPHTWMHQDDVEQLSQHDLTRLNFQAIEAQPTIDFVHTLDESWLTDAFESIASHFDPEIGPDSSKVKWFYNDLIRSLKIRDAGGMADWNKTDLRKQLFAALHMLPMGISELTRRLVVKHDSEWHSHDKDPRWSVLFDDKNLNPMKKVNAGFLKATRWMDKVPPFKDRQSVWHFHPLEFLEMISSKSGCACNRDITLEELCLIAPDAEKATLEQYLPAFNEGFRQYGMITCRQKAHFLAQCCHESMGLRRTTEIGGSKKSYAPWYGRGLIQLTFQDKYERYGEFINHDFVSEDKEKEKVAVFPHCVTSAFWYYMFYENMNLNKYAQRDDFNFVTAKINGGFNGYTDRLKYFNVATDVLKANHLSTLEKNDVFSFEDSEIYNNRVYAYSWGRYHDPLSKEEGTHKDQNEALRAYRRALRLYQRKNDDNTVAAINGRIARLE